MQTNTHTPDKQQKNNNKTQTEHRTLTHARLSNVALDSEVGDTERERVWLDSIPATELVPELDTGLYGMKSWRTPETG